MLHVLPSLDPARGGPVTAVVELTRALLDAGVPCGVAAPRREAARDAGVPTVACRSLATPFGPLVRLPPPAEGPRVLHVHGIATLTPWSAFRQRAGPGPVVASMHGTLDWRLRHGVRGLKAVWHRRLDVPLLHRLDAIHVTRESEAEALARVGVPVERIARIPWTLRDAPPLPPAARTGPPYVASVGRLHPIKGLDRLIDAFALVAGRRPGLRLAVAGTGRAREVARLRAQAARRGVGDRLDVRGLLSREDLRRFLADAALLALPSHYENFGMVVLEALREGCPVVASRETPWADLEREGAGRWADFDDPAAAAADLEALLDPTRRAEAGAAARRVFERAYAPGRVAPRFRAWYEAILSAGAVP